MASSKGALAAGRAITVIGLGRVIELAVQDSGLSSAKFRALCGIQVGATASGLLARFLNVTPSTVTTVMDGLVDYELTSRGIAAIDAANTAALAAIEAMAAFIDPAQRDLALGGIDLWTRAIEARRQHWDDAPAAPGATP